MALGSPASGENENLSLYKWQEKEISTTVVSGSEKDFEFTENTGATGRVIKSLTGLHATQLIPAMLEADSNGVYTYNYYDTTWKTGTGNLQMADCKVYFRKNGIDTIVSGATASITSVKAGTSKIEVNFAQNVTTDMADQVLLSYAYQDYTNPEPSSFCVKDFDVKHNGRDYSTIQCIGGLTFKRRQPLDLTEVSLTTLKTGNSLSGIMLGERTNVTMNSIATRNVTGGNAVCNWAMSLSVVDPDNSKNKLYMIATNIGATGVNPKGGADADLEESISFKAEPRDYCEIEYTST